MEVKSVSGVSAQSKRPARLRNKRVMMKGLADPSNPHVRHGRACILCQLKGGGVPPPPISTQRFFFFPRVHCSSCVRVCVHPGAGVLVSKQNAGETRTCCYLHHHSVCLSRCSPYGLVSHNGCTESFFEAKCCRSKLTSEITLVPDRHKGMKT